MTEILPMTNKHREDVLAMMRTFYASPAVATYRKNSFTEMPYMEMKRGR